ncbi:hypothetical protein D3C81_837960 [compost metagenome]
MGDLSDQDLLLPDVALQAIRQQPPFQQATVKFELQLFNAQRGQFWRQQAQNIVALVNAADLFRQRGRHLDHYAERFRQCILLLHRLGLIAPAQLLRQFFQLRLLLQEIAVFHQPLVVAALQVAFAHIPQPPGGGVVFRQQRLQRTAQRQTFLQLRHQLLSLLFQQLMVQHGGL